MFRSKYLNVRKDLPGACDETLHILGEQFQTYVGEKGLKILM